MRRAATLGRPLDAQVAQDRALPSGPTYPALAQLATFLYLPRFFLARSRAQFGTPLTIRLPGVNPIVMFDDPAAIKEVFRGSPEELHAGEANGVLRPFLGRHSVLVLDGDRHMQQRRILLPPFRGERMKAYGTAMRDITLARMREWTERPMAMQRETQAITLGVILRTVFGLEEGARAGELPRLLVRMLRRLDNPMFIVEGLQKDLGPWSPWGRFLRERARVRELLNRQIAERREEGRQGRDDVLSLLTEAAHEDGAPMTDDEIRDELMTMLVAGHETTATALSWCAHRLTKHPEVLRRVQAELAAVFPEGAVDTARLNQLPYLDAFAKETLRVHPVIPGVGRVVQSPVTIGGTELPAGVMVACNIFLTHTNPKVWPDPHRFDPDRFLGRRVSPYEFLPFGGGIRRCIGESFALYEMRVVLATMLLRWEPVALRGVPVTTVRRNITLSPSFGMPVRFRRRFAS
ncbi:MAG: cytochrome P450 [Myxococcota bacterium]